MAKSEKVGFRDSVAAFGQVSRDIDARRFASIYLLMGDEPFFIDQLSDKLASGVLTEAERAFNQIVAYGKDSDVGNIINFAKQMPMMGNYQVIIVREAQQLKKLDQLHLYTQAPSPSTILVLCHKEKNLDKRTPLYKQIREKGVVFESAKPRDHEIGPWLGEFIRSRGCAIEPKALNMLTEHLGVDISKISNELTKLLTFLPAGTKTITADHIEQNIGISKDFNNFELTRALSERDMGKALMIAEHFGHNANYKWYSKTLSTIFTHFQRIFLLNYQKWLAKYRNAKFPQDAELARMLKLTSSYFVGEYKTAAASYPNKKVFAILGYVREYDMKGKGMNSGDADKGELLRELLLKIFLT
jgi:DNA polymerase-3 subunit delta